MVWLTHWGWTYMIHGSLIIICDIALMTRDMVISFFLHNNDYDFVACWGISPLVCEIIHTYGSTW